MALIKAIIPKRSGSWDSNTYTYSESWHVQSNDTSTGPFDVLDFVWNDIVLEYHGTQLNNLSCQQEDIYNWIVTAEYKNLSPEDKEKSQVPNPLDREVVVSFQSREADKIADKTVDDDGIVNSAKDPFSPAPVIRAGKAALVAVKNFSSFDATAAKSYTFKTNGSTLFGIGTNKLLCTSISCPGRQSESVDGDQVYYYPVTFEFEIDDEYEHTLRLVDCGYNELISSKLVKIKDEHNEDLTEPSLLNGSGTKLPSGNDPHILEFDVYKSADFGVFNF